MLRELALLFLRLGATAFGGPAAHIAMMEEEVVRRRRWLRREEFSLSGVQAGAAAGLAGSFSLGLLFLLFLKISAVLFGSGYVLLVFLRTDLVEFLHWLTEGSFSMR